MVLESILKEIQNAKVIDDIIGLHQYVSIDLSLNNVELSKFDITDASLFEEYIENHLKTHNAKVAFGGYKEERNLYKRSSAFKDETIDERNIHIGLDLWIKAGSAVLAPIDGTVHSYKFNSATGDYGPTIILKHEIQNHTFYTLYGHLSLESITNLEIGAVFKKGQKLATLGDCTVNGDYAPHLHFQIIRNIENNFGDYPGVCSRNNLVFYAENCPDPNLLLKIP